MAIKKRPVSPRQKMINLMYVVLMAMLALNVSTEVLNGFSVVEESLNRTTANSAKENASIYNDFNDQMKLNPSKVKAWYDKANLVKQMSDSIYNFAQELKKLTEMLGKVSEQSERLTRDSEEMENLNRTLTGICKVYEMQLKGASQQIGTIDQINEQSRKMAEQIGELNKIYARMIEAMTVNMPKAGLNKVNGQDGFGGQDGIPQ